MTLHTADEVAERLALAAVLIGEDVAAGLLVDDRLMDMHGRSGLTLNGLGHEGSIHIVLERCLADRALEHEDLIGKLDGIAVAQVDFKLARAFLVDQRVDLQPLSLEMVDIVDQFVEFVDAGDRIALPPMARPERPTGGVSG